MFRQRLGVVSLLASFVLPAEAWTLSTSRSSPYEIISQPLGLTTTTASAADDNTTLFKPSFYATKELDRRGKPVWKPRKKLSELKVGDPLQGFVVQEHLEGVTGPKVYLECGVGRYNPQKQTWKMVNGMLRLGRRDAKASATNKRVARLRNKDSMECYVSRIYLDTGNLEVVLKPAEVPPEPAKLVSVSSLRPGQEVVGTVNALVPYGVFVDVGANRLGLLHIQKVADLYGTYIDKEKGLEGSGLERGAKIKLQVERIEKRRLSLDFTEDVKEGAAKEREEREKRKAARRKQEGNETATTTASLTAVGADALVSVGGVSEEVEKGGVEEKEDVDPWAAYAAASQGIDNGKDRDEEADEDDYDDYDEDRDIEDALGLGTY
jgi:predicted RNA-binding protein with RPS1 domain